MRRALAFAPLALFVLIAAVALVALMRPGERAHFTPGLLGAPVPVYELARLDGQGQATPAAFAGRAYVINLFASWCAPCRAEHPHLMALAEAGVPILGIAYKDAPAASAALLRELGDPYALVGVDRAGDYALEIGVTGVPETFVIGADGRMRAAHRGPLTDAAVRDVIMPALRAPS